MEIKEVISKYLNQVIEGLKADAQEKGQKIPQKFRVESDNISGQLYAAHYFKYLIYGRGPGKAPPPDAMLKAVEQHPEWLAAARATFKYINERGLAFLIGRKIAREGTDIFSGKRQGIDLIGIMEKNMPGLLDQLAKNEALKIQTSIHNAIKQ